MGKRSRDRVSKEHIEDEEEAVMKEDRDFFHGSSSSAVTSLYEILGVEKTASQAEIKKAYHKLALRLHPDKNPNDEEAKEKFQLLQKVISVLGDEEKRAVYDQTGCADDADLAGDVIHNLRKMSKAREPVEIASDDNSSSEEIESEPESIWKSSAAPASARKPQTPSATKPAPPDEDSGSDIKSRKHTTATGKDKAAAASASPARSTRKRVVEEVKGTEPTVTKKQKNSKKAEPEASDKKKMFQRIWSDADEIAVLNGIMQFRAEKKFDPYGNFDAFFEFIKKNLHIDVTKKQLRDKMFRMKKKYTNNKRKEEEGKGRTFTSQQEQEAYDLSEKVWGAEKDNGVEKANGSGAEKENVVEKANGSGADTNNIMEDEEALKKLEIEEMEVYVRHFKVKVEQAKLLLQVMKSQVH
ncbi:Chaperone DnaJ-domain superfamily protein [Striga hermonthica]|uniref:Chaperone DnaJ-domain superfamily protein n=1 Tax=Striga hermonthica TaxID=68872 RepID=A0A9N7NVM2_STRHE|nr:Chaperone DnaJ-domain superfamily protein [Striga hermonthica]